MTRCCHCGRVLTYQESRERGCGSWCYNHRGLCKSEPIFKSNAYPNKYGGKRNRIIKGIAKRAVIGAAIGVSCVLAHVACLITTFINHHEYLESIATSVYSVLKNRSEHDEHPVKEAAVSGSMETSSRAGITDISSKIGKKFAEAAHQKYGVSKVWANEVGKETTKSMLEQGSSAIFDWSSKAVV